MGAMEFEVLVAGGDAQLAFEKAVEQAAWDYGHGGYTGTIAEKHDYHFVAKEVMTYDGAMERMEFLMEYGSTFDNEYDERCADIADDKWGPAAAIEIDPDTLPKKVRDWGVRPEPGDRVFLFFGWASS